LSNKYIDISKNKFGRWFVENYAFSKNRGTYWNCICDCGEKRIVNKYSLTSGKSKSCGCLHKEITSEIVRKRLGKLHPYWRGGKFEHHGYVYILDKENLNVNANGYVAEHVKVMSEYLGRPIDTKIESIHHKNGIRNDNRIENLELRIKGHGYGHSVEDAIDYAIWILKRYKPEILKGENL